MSHSPPPPDPQRPRLLDHFRLAASRHGHSGPTTDALAAWARPFIRFHDQQHPSTLSLPHVTRSLELTVAHLPDGRGLRVAACCSLL